MYLKKETYKGFSTSVVMAEVKIREKYAQGIGYKEKQTQLQMFLYPNKSNLTPLGEDRCSSYY